MEQEFFKDFLKQAPSSKAVIDWSDIGFISKFFPQITVEYALADKAVLTEGFNTINCNKILASWLFDLKRFYPALSTGRIFLSIENELVNIELLAELPFSFGPEKTQEFLRENQNKWKKNLQYLNQKQSYRFSQKLSDRVTTLRMTSLFVKR